MSESLITKRAIAQGFKELINKKSLDKITIADITEICGLNRQTFYYHFQDKYELVNWIYYNEAISIISNDLTIQNWDQKVLELLDVMKNESYFYMNTLRNTNSNEFHNYLYCVIKEIFSDIIENLVKPKKIDDTDKEFIAEFISYGVVGMIVAWAKSGMKQTPESISSRIKTILEECKMFAASRYLATE